MRGFIKHSLDCSEIVQRVEVSHPGILIEPGEGFMWTEVPNPVDWTVALVDDEVTPVPFVRATVAQVALAKMDLLRVVKDARERSELGGCTVGAIGRFETDADSQRKISGSVVMAMITGAAFSAEWRLADNNYVQLDAASMQDVGLAVGQHVALAQYRKNELDSAINTATTIAELEAIDVNADWP